MKLRGTSRGASVAVFGGGISGLTAAHELAARGFKVDVYEKRTTAIGLGGKARTQFWKSGPGGGTLPGEHGFRFFPAFYHLTDDTMARIPLDPAKCDPRAGLESAPGASALDNLEPVPKGGVARAGSSIIEYPRRMPQGFHDLTELIQLYFGGIDIPALDLLRIGLRLNKFFMSGDRRRREEYEPMRFWDFLDADGLGPEAQAILISAPKSAVAMDAKQGSARTLGNMLFLMMRDQLRDGSRADRTLKGPTTLMWMEPWRRWLERLGVRFHYGRTLRGFDCERKSRRVVGARLAGGQRVRADHYVAALPLDVMNGLVSDDLAACCEQLEQIRRIDLDRALGWMVGAQFYLRRDVRIIRGHIVHPDSQWALTSISQAQFWSPRDFRRRYGNGRVAGILSVDVSTWDEPGPLTSKPAKRCTRRELQDELLHQLGACQTKEGRPILESDNVVDWHLDDDIVFAGGKIKRNDSRLLIHPPNLFPQRPTAATGLRNLFLAGDYTRTDIDLATMEGANESGRAAANAILDATDHESPRSLMVDHLAHSEPAWLRALKALDDLRFGAASALDWFDWRAASDEPPRSREEAIGRLREAEGRVRKLARR